MSEPNHETTADQLRVMSQGATETEAMAFFDSLPPVQLEEMVGSWRGTELPTGHRLGGVLGILGWKGKKFDDENSAHPLVFQTRTGREFEVNPRLVPLNLALRCGPLLRLHRVGRIVRPFLELARTTRPRARLRMMEYRGTVSATMVYDALPVNDAFRRIDSDTLLGAMDMREPGPPFLFSLHRISNPQ